MISQRPAAVGGRTGGRGRRLPLALLGAFAILLTLGVATSSAATYAPGTPASLCTGTGTGAGECGELKGVAVDQSNGHIYVVDQGNNRVDEFEANGTFVRAFGTGVADGVTAVAQVCTATCFKGLNTGAGAFGTAAKGIAVDPETHVVYILTAAARVAYYNGTTGAYIGQTEGNNITGGNINAGAPEKFVNGTGVAVDTSNPLQHYLYVAIRTKIDKFQISAAGVTTGSYVCQITGTALATSVNSTECGGNGLAAHKDGAFEGIDTGTGIGVSQNGGNLVVDANGNVFILESITRQVVSEFDKTGNFVTQFIPTKPRPEAVAVLPSGNLLLADDGLVAGGGGARIEEYNPASPVSPLSDFGFGTIGSAAGGSLGVATSGTDVYVADAINKKIWKFSPVASAPTVTTEAATAVTKTTATLNGKVNPNFGNVTACKFEYGTTIAYGSEANCASLPGAGSSPVAVSAAISGLSASTTYHFRLVATNSAGTTNGSDLEFTTSALNKPTVTTTAGATGITQTAATAAGTVNPNGLNVTDCKVQYGTTVSYGSEANCASLPGAGSSPVAVSASLTGLSAKTLYHFRVVATNADGTENGSDQTFETLPNVPTVTTTAGATGITQTAATAAGTVNPNSGNVTACKVEYGTTVSYGSQQSCASLPGSGSSPVPVSVSLTGLAPNTTYHFRVVATNAGGTTNGSDQTFTTLPNVPTVTTTAGATGITQTAATAAGTVNPNSGNVTACKVEYGTTVSYGSQQSCASLPGSGTSPVAVSASLTGLTANTTYHFRVVATNAGGTTNGSDQTFTTLPNVPTVTTTAGATGIAQTTAKAAGTVNPNSGNVTACKVEYGTTVSYGSQQSCASLPGSGASPVAVSASLTGLTANTTYHFRVVATNAGGTTNGSDQTFTTLPNTHPLTVTKSGTGSGSVTCNGAPCAPTYNEGTVVTFAASPASDSTFAGWGGACSGSGACVVTINAATTVTVTFTANTPLPVLCVVPKLVGKTLGQAKSALTAAHCTLGKVTKPKAKKGKKLGPLVVKSSSPVAGTSLPEGSKVNLKLAKKPKKAKKGGGNREAGR